jgi:hypothetical protein
LTDVSTFIENYEQRIDRQKAKELNREVSQILKKYSNLDNYGDIYLDWVNDYMSAIE